MKKNTNRQPIKILSLSIGIMLLCNACMINVPLPSQARPTSENQNQAEAIQSEQDTPCSPGDALEKSTKENLSPERDIGASGFIFSRITEAAAMLDPTGVVGAARTGHGAYQVGKVSVEAHKNHDDCIAEQKDLLQKEPESDAVQ